MAIASLVLSIVAIMFCALPLYGLGIALIAIIISIIAMCRKKNKELYRGFKTAGLILSLIAFVISFYITGDTVASAYLVAKNNQEIKDKVNNVVVESDLAELRSKISLAWMEQYIAGTTPTVESLMEDDEIKELLEEINNRSKDVKYEIVVGERGVEIKEIAK